MNMHKLYKFNCITGLWISIYHGSCISEKSQSIWKSSYDIGVYIKFFKDFWFVFLIYAMPSPLVDSPLGKEAVRNSWG